MTVRRALARCAAVAVGLAFAMAEAGCGENSAPAVPRTIEIPFETHDGHPLFGKLAVPTTKGRHAALIYVQTAEAATVPTAFTGWSSPR
jgi:hypothetical protein